MKILLLFLLLLIMVFIFPLRMMSLPDDWILSVKDNVREFVSQQTKEKSSTTNDVPKSYINDIKLGMTKTAVDKLLGKPQDELTNQYNNSWYVYHHHFDHFILVSYEKQRVEGIYIVASPFNSIKGVKYGMNEKNVKNILGEPLKVFNGQDYRLKLDEPHTIIYLNKGVYYTYYFDQHENNKLVGMKVVTQSMENQKPRLYANPSDELKKDFETLDYYLINADRVKYGLPALSYHDKISITAFNHSRDMSEQGYFSHTNLEGLDPFDRMQRDGLHYSVAGENLAYGQVSPIEAHHGLMNSLGHRKNILNEKFEQVGIGVAFNPENIPFYTENYITEN
ncbi:CAP-associated domain-containing protein [Macrococcus lamae]|nr:CAP-associated domain-containing protein [Macrococcus lamae]